MGWMKTISPLCLGPVYICAVSSLIQEPSAFKQTYNNQHVFSANPSQKAYIQTIHMYKAMPYLHLKLRTNCSSNQGTKKRTAKENIPCA